MPEETDSTDPEPPAPGTLTKCQQQVDSIQRALRFSAQSGIVDVNALMDSIKEVVNATQEVLAQQSIDIGDEIDLVGSLLNCNDEIADAMNMGNTDVPHPKETPTRDGDTDLPTLVSKMRESLQRLLSLTQKNMDTMDPSSPTQRSSHYNPHERQKVRVHIRWMIRRDMPEVLGIENESFEFPWLEEDFIRCLRQRNSIGMVAEHDEKVVGFMIYELNKTQIQVLNFATSDEYRRRGVGSQMVVKLIGKLSSQRRTQITLEVRETNLPAQLFFRANGFRATSVLRDFYEDTPEDAYVMQYKFRPTEGQQRWDSINRIARLAG